MLDTFTLYSGTASGPQTSVFLPATFGKKSSNTGHVQVVGAGTVTLEGSANGANWISIVTGVTSANGFHIAVFPHMRANITTASGTTTVFLVI